jgi:hypothetical protein
MVPWVGIPLLLLLLAGILLYIFAFIFLSGSKATGAAYDAFVMDICSPNGDKAFIRTVFTWGYFKRSFKQFYQHYRLKWFPVPKATLGSRCPDAKLVSLDGEELSLLDDFVNKMDPDMPLILNMGSYT